MREGQPRVSLKPFIILLFLIIGTLFISTGVYELSTMGVSGYQGWQVEFSGVVLRTGEEWWGWWSYELHDFGSHLYTSTSTEPPPELKHNATPSVKDFGVALNLDPDAATAGVANFTAALDAIPTVVTGVVPSIGGVVYQSASEPIASYKWEYDDPDDPTMKKVFAMDLWILEFAVDMGLFPTNGEGKSKYNDAIVWLKLSPRNIQYFKENPNWSHFGIGALEVADLRKYSSKEESNSPYVIWTEGFCFPWYNQMGTATYTSQGTDPATFWNQAAQWDNTLLDPAVFVTGPVYIPMQIHSIRTHDDASVFSIFTGHTAKGDLAMTKIFLHTFVVGEWDVKKEVDVDWGDLDPYFEKDEGVLSWLADILGGIFMNPFFWIFSLLAIGVVVVVLFFLLGGGGLCLASRAGAGTKGMTKTLSGLREFRDKRLKKSLYGRLATLLYYKLYSPIFVALMDTKLLSAKFVWNRVVSFSRGVEKGG